MTEQEWLACADPRPMLEFVRGTASDRKLRLFAVACFRRNWNLLPNVQCQEAVEASERFADGNATAEQLAAALEGVLDWHELIVREDFNAISYARDVADAMRSTPRFLPQGRSTTIREIFNPFLPLTADPAWLTSTVVSLATAIYDERASDRLPILADALEDAGCTNVDMLNHCRQPGEHFRGCWVVDLLLGKK